jgi:hypothetical protein
MKHGTISYYYNRKCRCDECRAALATYQREYRKNTPAYRARESITRRKYFEKIRQFIREQKEGKPCVDCSMTYPYYVMQFDHRGEDEKAFMLSRTPGSIAKAKAEIAKCDLVCANCHASRTHLRRLTLFSNTVKL